MQILRVVGPSDSGKTTLLERLTERLTTNCRIATVKHLDCAPDIDTEGTDTARHRAAGSDAAYGVTSSGSWFGTGVETSFDALRRDLAPDYDYLLVEGYSDLALPTVALDGREHAGETLLCAPDADSVDIETLVSKLEERTPYETLESLVTRVKRSADAEFAGAIATFTGRVRARDSPDDPKTEHLEFESYERVAAERLATIEAELGARDGVYEVLTHHRTGVLEAGEEIVFVVVLAGHRREAFETVSDGIDRLKAEVPLFKKEVTVDETFWAHQHDTGETPE